MDVLQARSAAELALVDFPVSLRMESHLQQSVLGVVPLAASGTDQISAPGRALMGVILRHGKRRSTTAWHQKHAQRCFVFDVYFGLALGLNERSLTTLRRLHSCSSCAGSTAESSCAAGVISA